MKVTIKLFGTLRRLALPETPGIWEGDVISGSTINEILQQIGAGTYEANAALINGVSCTLDEKVSDESEITIVTPMGGG